MDAARFPDGKELDRLYAQRHQSLLAQIHRSVNMTEMHDLLQRLVALGMPKQQATAFHAQAEALEALLRTENNRIHKV